MYREPHDHKDDRPSRHEWCDALFLLWTSSELLKKIQKINFHKSLGFTKIVTKGHYTYVFLYYESFCSKQPHCFFPFRVHAYSSDDFSKIAQLKIRCYILGIRISLKLLHDIRVCVGSDLVCGRKFDYIHCNWTRDKSIWFDLIKHDKG